MAIDSPPPGWYEDPRDESLLRFWEGTGWTSETIPRQDVLEPANSQSHPSEGVRGRLKAKLDRDRENRRREQLLSVAHKTKQQTEHVRELEKELARVVGAALRGNILEEESARAQMLATARALGGSRLEKSAVSMLEIAQADGQVRIGSEYLGIVKSEGFFSQYARKEAMSKVSSGSSITVFSDRLFHEKRVYVIDEFTSAQVYLDGVEQITQRPTLTRMALLSPLPGTALIPGLALQKKKKNDMRHAEFLVGARDWSLTTPVDPDGLQEPRRLAQMINSNADSIANSVRRPTIELAPVAEPPVDIVSQLERIHGLREQGALTDEEFEVLKSRLLGGGLA